MKCEKCEDLKFENDQLKVKVKQLEDSLAVGSSQSPKQVRRDFLYWSGVLAKKERAN